MDNVIYYTCSCGGLKDHRPSDFSPPGQVVAVAVAGGGGGGGVCVCVCVCVGGGGGAVFLLRGLEFIEKQEIVCWLHVDVGG